MVRTKKEAWEGRKPRGILVSLFTDAVIWGKLN